MKSKKLEEVLPIYAIENNLLISKKGDISVVYKLELPQIYSMDVDSINDINAIFDKFIRSFPEGTIIQKQDYFFIDKVTGALADAESILTRSDNQFFFEKPTLSHECYLVLTKDSKNTISFTSKPQLYKTFIQETGEFQKLVVASMSFLTKENYFSAERLKDDALVLLLDKYFSLSKDGDTFLKDVFMDKKLQVGNKHAEIYSISSNLQLPIKIDSSIRNGDFSTPKTDFQIPFIQPISVGLDCNHIYNQVIYIEKSEKLYSHLTSKMNKFKSLAVISKENKLIYDQINDLIQTVLEKELKFVKQHYSVIIWNESQEGLDKNRTEIKNSFRELGMTPYQIKYAIENAYLNNCPGAALFLQDSFKFIGVSEQAPVLMNFESYYEGNKSGILFCDRKNGAPLRLDLWDEPVKRGLIVNRNRLIFGPSGTGKSFLINHIASQYFEQGHHIVMIDIGNSYKKLCQLCNGQYFTYDVGEPLQFNPFYTGGEEITVDKKVFIISLIIFLWKGDDSYRREEKQILAMYIDAYYEFLQKNTAVFACMSTFYEFVCANTVLEKEDVYFDKMSFQLSIRDFHDGKYAEILNSRNPIDLVAERFIVFEMDNIKDHPVLFPLVTMLCIDVVMSKIRQVPSVKKSIFIDECWKPISKGEMAEFIKYLYKTVRKFYGEVAIATQDVEDILDTAAGPAMINNTDTMILLSHKKKMASKDKFAKYLSFSESDLEKLFSTDKREVYIKVGSISNVYKVTVSPQRYACYSSNADENKTIYEVYNETENMELALNQFVESNN
ncbi:TraG family conjugative transposon ATPase [Aggregatimonas sangjinii]|uniref:TraG family conjugative transposon ATPase n=1 Tax=Aggregatimonas sangjinii TaxID=2583587 RepID=A0A5B7SUE9_9FLAO|nr:TraG family conjugative transposon ATPase [Aggregatimonas sangjinii]QCX00668.1 TraG family conjugative transposon ATPase [Aggregatimonas sangjinii]